MIKQLLLPVSLLPMGTLMELLKSVSLFGLLMVHVPLLLHPLHRKQKTTEIAVTSMKDRMMVGS
jgi:hypothetical protein